MDKPLLSIEDWDQLHSYRVNLDGMNNEEVSRELSEIETYFDTLHRAYSTVYTKWQWKSIEMFHSLCYAYAEQEIYRREATQ